MYQMLQKAKLIQIKQKVTEIALEDGKRMIITTMYKKGYSALQKEK